MAWRMYPCPNCGRPWIVCRGSCRRRNEELDDYLTTFDKDEKIDVSFQCYTCECHYDQTPNGGVKLHECCEHDKTEHDHSKRSLLLTTNWEDVAALWCENLITIGNYKRACEEKNMKVIRNETMHHYIFTRLDNIEGCYSCLFLNGKMNEKQYQYFENIHHHILDYLKGCRWSVMYDDRLASVGIWSSVKLFDEYLKKTLESDFFKENDIRIENRSF